MKRTYRKHANWTFGVLLIIALLFLPWPTAWSEELGIKGDLGVQGNLTVEKDATIHGKLNVFKEVGSLTEGLVLYYSFDEQTGAVVPDESGNGHNGTLVGATWTAEGKVGGAYIFDGVNDYIDVGGGLGEMVNGSSHSIAMWIKTSGTIRQIIIGDWDEGGSGESMSMEVHPGGTLLYQYQIGGWWRTTLYYEPMPLNEWVHIVATFDDATDQMKLYINGELADFTTYEYSLLPGVHTKVGCGGRPLSYLWNGMLDDIRIYNRALSDEEIAGIYSGTVTTKYGEFAAGKVSAVDGVIQTSETGVNSFMGNVGLGTAAPQEKLHVVGNALIEGNLGVNGQLSGDFNAGGHKVTNLGAPADSGDAANKEYVDGIITHIPEMGDLKMGEFTGQ